MTLFPDMVRQGLETSVIGRAVEKGLIRLQTVDIRDYTLDKHGKVDDYPYGGGAGMLMQAQPVYDAWHAVTEGRRIRTVYLTPQGVPFHQGMAEELAREEELVFLCGHYEGIDERVLEEIITDRVSIGDYVLTGGELAAMVMIDAISRLVPGVLGNEDSARGESFSNDLLEYPQYSRPPVWHERKVPDVLLSGNHAVVTKWRLERSLERTAAVRPDLYARYREKQEVIGLLSRHKREYIHMMETLSRGDGEVLFVQGESVLLHARESGVYLVTSDSPEAGERLAALIREDSARRRKAPEWFVVSQPFLIPVLERAFGALPCPPCVQACFTRKEPLPVPYKQIERLGPDTLDALCTFYPRGGREYLKDRLTKGKVYGAGEDGRLIGVIGLHDDGSMGMLYVDEPWRGRGIACSLEAFLINRLLELGQTPYCQIEADNLPSLRLQEKLGLYLSRGEIWWVKAGEFS